MNRGLDFGPHGAVAYTTLFVERDGGISILVNYNRVLFLKCP